VAGPLATLYRAQDRSRAVGSGSRVLTHGSRCVIEEPWPWSKSVGTHPSAGRRPLADKAPGPHRGSPMSAPSPPFAQRDKGLDATTGLRGTFSVSRWK
jgi:hypothetical protein